MSFTQAVEQAAHRFGCQPYLTEECYRQELLRGRIRYADLEKMLRKQLGNRADEEILPGCSRFELRWSMLKHPLRFGSTAELQWFVAETDALRRIRSDVSTPLRYRLIGETRRWVMRDWRLGSSSGGSEGGSPPRVPEYDRLRSLLELRERFGHGEMEHWSKERWEEFTLQVLWRVCRDGMAIVPAECLRITPLPVRHRDWLLRATGVDSDVLVHGVLIPFCAAYVDQGLAHWSIPSREKGFFHAFIQLYRLSFGPADAWRRSLSQELRRWEQANIGPIEAILESLEVLGVPVEEWDEFLTATVLALRGWAGMIWFLENHPERAIQPLTPGSLWGYVAIRLLLERLALTYLARERWNYTGDLRHLRTELARQVGPPSPPSVEQRAFVIFQLAQVLGWTPEQLFHLLPDQWLRLWQEIESFSAVERRRLYHLAYEQRFLTQALDAIHIHNRRLPPRRTRVRFQALFCIDEREESLRRHLEELAPEAETYGVPGFFYVPMYYRGLHDAHFVPLCPVTLKPRHWVEEVVQEDQQPVWEIQERTRQMWDQASHRLHTGSRGITIGALLSGLVGSLAVIPLVLRTFFPRYTARLGQWCSRWLGQPPVTHLQLQRTNPEPAPTPGGIGFTPDEMADCTERVLRDIGLTRRFARWVLLLGHGSTSLNNSHESAHDCGACGGSRGGPNARAMACMLNHPQVRQLLQARGIRIPPSTIFVGAMHNTSSEEIVWYDLNLIPETRRKELESLQHLFKEAARRNAHERCRRFESAPLSCSFEEARRHVESRAEDLAQVRPEWGHATNAVCIIGRRQRTRGLFLDRRAFLVSNDPTQDGPDGVVLGRILQAALPVCAGINLEYYFSRVDNVGYGCGTKLPHNITALVGVMDGAAGDLRTGLPWQMVEIHEPMRLICVVETTPTQMQQLLSRLPVIGRLVHNEWVYLVVLDPDSAGLHFYHKGQFHPYQPTERHLPHASSSVAWYRGWREHLEFARIET